MRIVERYSRPVRMFLGRGGWSVLSPLRLVLSGMYRLQAGRRGTGRVQAPASGPAVISVGNLEVGGGGKTPCVLALAGVLREKGKTPAVVTRGYGGRISGQGDTAVCLPGDVEEDAALYGDEALLYMRAGIPLAIDRDRSRGIRNISMPGITHILLDDAFHLTSVPRSLDILLLDWRKPFGNGRLLPSGSLREPPRAVRRAGAVIFTRAEERKVPDGAGDMLGDVPVFYAEHVPRRLVGRDGTSLTPSSLSGKKISIFSGIARPESFERTAVESGLDAAVSFRFDDHHAYSDADVSDIMAEAGDDAVFVTTEKDWVKVAGLFPEHAMLLRLEMRMEIDRVEELLAPVLGK